MALQERQDSMTYVGVYDGQLEVRVPKGTAGASSREKTKQGKPTGETIYVKTYGSLTGRIVDIKKDDKKLPDGTEFSSFKILIDDIGDKYVLNWPYDNGLTSTFFHVMEGIDFSVPVEFSVGKSKNKNGKDVTSLFIKQNGANLKWKYSKAWKEANPTLPQKPDWEEIMVKGKMQWDNSKEIKFFEAILENVVRPRLKSATPSIMGSRQSASSVIGDDDSWIPSAEPAARFDDNGNPLDEEPIL